MTDPDVPSMRPVDLTARVVQHFLPRSEIVKGTLGDSPATVARCDLLLADVQARLRRGA